MIQVNGALTEQMLEAPDLERRVLNIGKR